jgi:hypothetical protein
MECSPELIRGDGYQFDNSDFQVILRNTNDDRSMYVDEARGLKKQLVFGSYSSDAFSVVSDFSSLIIIDRFSFPSVGSGYQDILGRETEIVFFRLSASHEGTVVQSVGSGMW